MALLPHPHHEIEIPCVLMEDARAPARAPLHMGPASTGMLRFRELRCSCPRGVAGVVHLRLESSMFDPQPEAVTSSEATGQSGQI